METNHVFSGRMASIISCSSMELTDLPLAIIVIFLFPLTVPLSLSGGPDNLVVKDVGTVSFCH